MPNIIWPSVVNCVVAVFLHGGDGGTAPKVRPVPVKQSSNCQTMEATVHRRALVVVKGIQRVEIPIPRRNEWRPLQYWWGTDTAYIGEQAVNVRMGPKTLY